MNDLNARRSGSPYLKIRRKFAPGIMTASQRCSQKPMVFRCSQNPGCQVTEVSWRSSQTASSASFCRRQGNTPNSRGCLSGLYPTKEEVDHFFSQPEETFDRVVALAAPDERAQQWRPVVESLIDAFCLLGARVQGLGLSEKLRVRGKPRPVQQSAFYLLPRTGDMFISALRSREDLLSAERQWRNSVKGCRDELKIIVENMDKRGVNLDVVYAIDVIEQSLGRMDAIADVLTADPGHQKRLAAQRFLREVVRGRLADRSLLVLPSNSMRLMSKKIVEWAGKTGEHYIASNRKEYWLMWRAALGGGLLTVGTATIKMVVTHSGFGPFVEGFLAGTNYAVSFVLLQVLGLALATKQPSMTGAALAQIVLRCQQSGNDEELATFVARIFRTQLAAALGNILAVAAGAIGLGFLWHVLFGSPLLHEETAEYAVTSLNPIKTLTIFYAALTGVILWLSSLVGGWIENWVVYHRLPEAIAEHRLGTILKPERLQRISKSFARNVSGWGGSIALGYMLGMTPTVGKFFGLPLDVRHVTLSTGTVALGAVSLNRSDMPQGALFWAAIGIAVTFVLNLSVSFYLALKLALKAHGANLGGNLTIARPSSTRFGTRHEISFSRHSMIRIDRYRPVTSPTDRSTLKSRATQIHSAEHRVTDGRSRLTKALGSLGTSAGSRTGKVQCLNEFSILARP